MLSRPPGPNRPNFDCIAFDLGSHLRRVFDCVGFEPAEPSEVGTPGTYTGTGRCGGDTYAFAVKLFGREVMTKFDDENPSTSEEKTKVATQKFWEAERLCAATNRRFHKYLLGHRPANEQVARVMLRARDKIGKLMSDVDWERVKHGCTFTSGGSVLLRRGRSTPIHKYSSALESTETSLSTVSRIFSEIPSLRNGIAGGSGIKIVPGNKLTCVPKNYKTHRMIAGEPSAQMYVQKGLHKEIRRRLKQVGVNLDNQETNQDWARLGSATGLVATVDMSMASDTVAYNVVEWFYSLVPDVFSYLDEGRSESGKLASSEVTYEKFSSMGNATTFEVETSIFWSLASATCDVLKADSRFVGVYGDDVVIPNRAVGLFFEVLKECGFVPNEKKTFYEERPHALQHRYRESCGKQYYRGQDVTPVYIRKQPKDLLDYFKLVNNLERWKRTLAAIDDAPCLKKLERYISELRAQVPVTWVKPRIPDGYGDGAFIGTFDECTPRTHKSRKRLWVEGFAVEVLTERFDQAVGRAACGAPLVRRGKTSGKKLSKLVLLDSKDERKVTSPVTALGFALASLEKLERGTSGLPRNMLYRVHPRVVAFYARDHELATEGISIELKSTRQVVPTLITIPLSGW